MKLSTTALLAAFLFAAATPASAIEWRKGDGQSCIDACKKGGRAAIASGPFKNTRDQFYVCAADQNGEGWRSGYNLKPHWANVCMVPWGGKELRAPSYLCACE